MSDPAAFTQWQQGLTSINKIQEAGGYWAQQAYTTNYSGLGSITLNGVDYKIQPATGGVANKWISVNGAKSAGNIDWKGVTNASILLVGGLAEMAVGGVTEYLSVGTTSAVSLPLIVDGGVRTVANTQRLWLYLNGNSKVANAYPTSTGALAGKGIDMTFGVSPNSVGFGQTIGGCGNDLISFVLMGGNGAALFDLQKSPSLQTGLNYGFSLFSYPYSLYVNKPTQ